MPQEFALGQDRQGRQDYGELEKYFAKVESERLPASQMALLLQPLRPRRLQPLRPHRLLPHWAP